MTVTWYGEFEDIPIAIVDGYLPKSSSLDRTIQTIAQFGYSPTSINWSRGSLGFRRVSELLNDCLEVKVSPEHSMGLHHYIFRKWPTGGRPRDTLTLDQRLGPLGKLEAIRSNFEEPDYTLNLIADPRTVDWCLDDLRAYMTIWTLTTGFELKDKSTYEDLARFSDECQKVMAASWSLYLSPLRPLVNAISSSLGVGVNQVMSAK